MNAGRIRGSKSLLQSGVNRAIQQRQMEVCRYANSIRAFSSKNDDDDKQPPKGFEKFFKKKKEAA